MKIFLALGAAVFLATSAGAAEMGYQFKTIDINGAPGQTSFPADPVRINDRGGILANASFGERLGAVSINNYRRGLKPTTHFCPGSIYTEGKGISNWNDVAGFCKTGEDDWSGFISRPNGQLTLLDYPGAYYTFGQGISPNGRYVVGQFWAQDFSTHCFVWDGVTRAYKEISPFPGREGSTYLNCFAINQGRVLGEYIFFDSEGEYSEHGYFVWNKGEVTIPLPLSHDFEEGPAWYAIDFNKDGQILVLTTADGGINSTLAFYDDGVLFDVKLPDGVPLNTVGGMNGRGQFVGRYQISAGVDPECYAQYQDEAFCTIYKTHGFIASPAPIKVASKKK